MRSLNPSPYTLNPSPRGFTLVELMVTIGIFAFMTALLLARYGSYDAGTFLNNTAYDIALTIRQAQSYGLSVKNSEYSSGTSGFSSSYGVHFALLENKIFTLFADEDMSGTYTTLGDSEEKKYNLKRGAKISGICVGSSSSICSAPSPAVVTITFRRPDPVAIICTSASCASPYGYAEISVQSADGSATKKIKINRAGQVSVSN